MNVSNRKCIRHLSLKSLRASKSRNIVAILAIALTTLLFTSLFTIALSINDGIQQSNFRQVGGYSHGGFKYLSQAQFDALKDDPLIDQWGLRRFVGMPMEVPFNKSHVEISYSDANEAAWMYCQPVEGRLPKEGTNEAATDTRVLELLGIEPKLGAEFTVSFKVDGHETTQTFTLCGWWPYDEAVVANHILIPLSRAEALLAEAGVVAGQAKDGMTGSYNMDVMLKSGARHIERDLLQILRSHGYQGESLSLGDNYIRTGVNWGYTGAQLSENLDPATVIAIAAMLLLIVFTGYLIIYNVFQISVAGDIRFYGLLKAIGTTPRQLRRIIRQQALALSLCGVPLGLAAGWFVGGRLTPVIVSRLDGVVAVTSANPLIFIVSALFAVATVLISCRRPGRVAGRVSPVEAVRYTEGSASTRKVRRSSGSVSLFSMALANLGRSRGKTALTIASLSLAVVLLSVTVIFARSFDMDKYVANFTASDFIVSDAGQFQTGGDAFNPDMALPESVIDEIRAQGGVTAGGRVYGKTSAAEEFVTEDYYRASLSTWYSPEQIDSAIHSMTRNADGLLANRVQLSGMDAFALDHLKVLEGDLSQLSPSDMDLSDVAYAKRALRYRDVEYTVAALVSVPLALSYRYFGADEFILNDQTFIQDTGTGCVMYYAFDTEDSANSAMEAFLADYTTNVNPQFDYESKATYAAEFESFRSMFMLLGGALSSIVALVGVLNFFNAIFTGIMVRRREFAVLQSIGMTGRQLKTMLVYEGLFYALSAVGAALAISLLLSPLLGSALSSMFWFITYRFTITPIVAVLPAFLLLGALVPLAVYRFTAKHTIVERLREAES